MKRIPFILVAFFAVGIGLYPSIYFLVDRDFGLLQSKSVALLSNPLWNGAFYLHIIASGIALLIGWMQFGKKFRTRKPAVHRSVGKVYVGTALAGAVSGLYISFFATGGWITATGFGLLAITWMVSTWIAYRDARNGRYEAHRKMMVYSYAACFAAVMLRIYLPLMGPAMGFIPAYQIISWLCWVPNMVVAWFITKDPAKVYTVSAPVRERALVD